MGKIGDSHRFGHRSARHGAHDRGWPRPFAPCLALSTESGRNDDQARKINTMIQEIITHHCRVCDSTNIVKNGTTRCAKSCRKLWKRIPDKYRCCHTFSDFWHTYQQVIDSGKHNSVGKESGETAHVERWNNTLRQRISRYVRKTLSFSKTDKFHYLVTKWYIYEYNLLLTI